MNSYPPGNTIRVTANLATSGAAVDPTAISCIILPPGATTPTTYTPTRDSTGVYHQDIPVEATGQWQYAFKATGTAAAGAEGSFFIRTSALL